MTKMPELETPNLTHLFLRRSNLNAYEKTNHPSSLQELDLSESNNMRKVDLSQHHDLVALDLSQTMISSIDSVSDKVYLRQLILRGCKWLAELPDLSKLRKLEVLDLHGTQVRRLPSFAIPGRLHTLSLQGLKLDTLENLASLSSLVQLDLSDVTISSSQEFKVDFLQSLENLQILNLSRTSVAELPGLAKLISLKILLLADCQRLTTLPDLKILINLEKLELSVRNHSGYLQNLVFTNPFDPKMQFVTHEDLPFSFDGKHLPISVFNDLLNRIEDVQIQMTSKAAAAATAITTTNNKTDDHVNNSTTNSGAATFATATSNTIVENVDITNTAIVNATTTKNDDGNNTADSYTKAASNTTIGVMMKSNFADTTSDSIKDTSKVTDTATNSKNDVYMRQLEMLKMDVEYIKKHIESVLRSPNRNWAEELVQHFIDARYHLEDEFAPESPKLKQLVQAVAKLKLLVPRTQIAESGTFQITKKQKENVVGDVVKELVGPEIRRMEIAHYLNSYDSLTADEKQCLLCFSVFPCDVFQHEYKSPLDKYERDLICKRLEIKKKILIYWWVGEGFIDIHREENFATKVSEQVTPSHRGKKKKTVEDIGEQILKVLTEKGFIKPVIEKGRDTGRCQMHPFVHSFVVEQAKKANFFDFSNQNSKLAPSFTRSCRACVLKYQDSFLSSCHLWEKYAKSSRRLESFKTVRTMFNVNESIINIQPEYFSKMKDLLVLHLGNWQSGAEEHIEVGDQKFLEDLKNMKQLKLFSLQGVSTIMKLPDSICKVSSLVILDLRACHDLEELPTNIGSLKNLTHLDLTNCHLLSKLPKGISLLSKLVVLKGFVIYDQPGDPQDKKASKTAKGHLIHDFLRFKNNDVCTLRDLLKLENLRKLSIVVNNKRFPDSEDLKVFKKMENLRKLMISWVYNLKDDDNSSRSGHGDTNQGVNKTLEESSKTCGRGALGQESESKNSFAGVALDAHNTGLEALQAHKSLEMMKCFKRQASRKDGQKKSRREFLDQIEKLELWCFPCKSAQWLVPDELKSLQKLYIKGGKLEELSGGINGNEWKVTTLLLKHLPELVMTWAELKTRFPNMTYLEKHECKKLGPFSDDFKDVWRFKQELP